MVVGSNVGNVGFFLMELRDGYIFNAYIKSHRTRTTPPINIYTFVLELCTK